MGTRPALAVDRRAAGTTALLRQQQRPLLALLLLLAGALSAGPAPAADPAHEPLAHFPASELVVDAGGRSYPFKVWMATTDARREQGLMYVTKLPPDHGMLFVFDSPHLLTFWMKNTKIPLDLLFIASNGQVIRIAENAEPESLSTISSMGAALGVLELAGGTASRLGLQPGVRVRHSAFGAHP